MLAEIEETEETEIKHVMAIMGKEGDIKTIWDATKADEVAAAKKQFDDMTKDQKYVAYRVDSKGDKGGVMKTFDADAEKIILAPRMVGG